ncbi:MAG: hypothetical protein C0615_07530 [Desulfuromonas sp.]|nr:MAG: hypothetical protein C0615_07530 [Desulfuromonas sp.]
MKTFATLFFIIALAALFTSSAAADEALARKLLVSQGCKGCHVLEGEGGKLGPALDKIGARLNADQIRQKLLDPKADNPKSYMPGFAHLKENELQAMIDFLSNRK